MVDDPASPTAEAFMELGAAVVREVAKLQRLERNAVRFELFCPLSACMAGLLTCMTSL